MKAFLRWLARVIGSAVTILLVIVFLPYLSKFAAQWMPDESSAAIRTSTVLASRLENSARLETLKVEAEGVIIYDIKAAFIGTVASINVQYQYAASFGIDLQKVQMAVNGKDITFLLPPPELLQDSLTPTEVYKNDFWYSGFSEMDYENLLESERVARREEYLNGENAQQLWNSSVAAFQATIEQWMQDIGGDLNFYYEQRSSDTVN